MNKYGISFAVLIDMRVRIIIWVIGLSLSVIGYGQSRTYVGLRAGGQASSAFIVHTIFPVNMDVSFIETAHVGAVFKHFNFRSTNPSALQAGFQSGINYIERGWQQNFPDAAELEPYQTRLGYLEVPIEAVLYWGQKNTKFYLTMGLYYERLISDRSKNRPTAEQIAELDDLQTDFWEYEAARDRVNGYGGRFALGAFTDLPFGTIQLEVFSSVSFSGVFEFTNRTTEIPDQSNLYSIGLSAAYLLRFGSLEF
ncbi:MAG: outer membrane beta-barrel protein [Cytophagales bacterium]|nr:outer membrane beta-barrel protein [Cytophagales bacterium]